MSRRAFVAFVAILLQSKIRFGTRNSVRLLVGTKEGLCYSALNVPLTRRHTVSVMIVNVR